LLEDPAGRPPDPDRASDVLLARLTGALPPASTRPNPAAATAAVKGPHRKDDPHHAGH
jgi:hypothetical protein